MRARITFNVDEPTKLIIIRYVGDLDGPAVNDALIGHYKSLENCWDYDSILDLRRFDGAVLATDIEDLGRRWEEVAKGRDKGRLSAIVSEDPHVHARFAITQSAFPHRTMNIFHEFEDAMEWIASQRQEQRSSGSTHA